MSNHNNPASLLIDALSLKQRAILSTALSVFTEEIDHLMNDHLKNSDASNSIIFARQMDFLLWAGREIESIKKTLFSECFPDDLNPIKYFSQEVELIKD